MDLWVWIAVFVVAWLLEAMASAAKKRQQRPPSQRPLPRPAPQASRAPAQRPRPAPRIDEVLEAIRDMTRPLPDPELVPLPRPRSRPAPPDEGLSAEVDVVQPPPESTVPTHVRVAEKYRPAALDEIGAPAAAPRRHRFALRPGTMRDAVVWSEVLRPPRSER